MDLVKDCYEPRFCVNECVYARKHEARQRLRVGRLHRFTTCEAEALTHTTDICEVSTHQ